MPRLKQYDRTPKHRLDETYTNPITGATYTYTLQGAKNVPLREQAVFEAGDLVAYEHPHKSLIEGVIIHQHKGAPYLWLVRLFGQTESYYLDVGWLRPVD